MLARMGKDVGCHAILHYHCQEVGYIMPTPIEPRAEAADLQRQYIEATRAAEDERAHRAVAERRMSFMHAAIREKRTPLL